MSNAKNRTLGHNAERYYAQEFRNLGFKRCITSRQGSRLYDSCKVDLMNIPFYVQAKAGIQRGLNPIKILKEMNDALKEFIPDHPDYPKIIIHKKKVGSGNKRNEYDEIVTMTFQDFKKLISHDNQNKQTRD
jgi:hypothetical protein